MERTKGTLNPQITYKTWILSALGGILFISLVFGMVTRMERNQIKGKAEGTLQFLKSLCMKYDDYELGNQTRDLQTITNKSVVLRHLYIG